jgi:hypothetical protein
MTPQLAVKQLADRIIEAILERSIAQPNRDEYLRGCLVRLAQFQDARTAEEAITELTQFSHDYGLSGVGVN